MPKSLHLSWRRRVSRSALGLGLLAAGALSLGCPGPVTILVVNVQNPNPRVGESTVVRVEVLANWFRSPVFYYRAQRGRVVGMEGESGPQGGYTRATNQARYHAPYTASYPTNGGIQQNDVIEVLVQDGTFTTKQTATVNVQGSSVVFASTNPQSPNGALMLSMDTNGSQQTQPQALKDLQGRDILGASPTISPNGQRLAYVYYPGDGTSKIMMRDSSGQVLALTNFARGLNLDPTWSPDGKFLAFAGNHESSDGTFEIYLMSVGLDGNGGTAVTRITNNNWDERHPSWNPVQSAPEPHLLAVAARKNNIGSPGGRGQNWNVYLMDRSGNYTREVSQIFGDGDSWAVEPNWRPDGNAVSYTRFGAVNNFQSGANKFQRIFVQDIQQGSVNLLPLNLSNTDPNSQESSSVWSIERPNQIYFLRSDATFPGAARIFSTLYQQGGTNTQQPFLVPAFQTIGLPLCGVAANNSNKDLTNPHPFDWK